MRDPYVEASIKADRAVKLAIVSLAASILAIGAALYSSSADAQSIGEIEYQRLTGKALYPERPNAQQRATQQWEGRQVHPGPQLRVNTFGNGLGSISDGRGNSWRVSTVGNTTVIHGSDGGSIVCTTLGVSLICNRR